MKNPILLPSHVSDIPQASRNSSQFSGLKRKFVSPKKQKKMNPADNFADADQKARKRKSYQQEQACLYAAPPQQLKSGISQQKEKLHEQVSNEDREKLHEHAHNEDLVVQKWQCGSPFQGDRISFGPGNEMDPDALTGCSSSSMTSLGRFGVWCPEDSVVKKPRDALMVPTAEDLENMYKLPKRRQRDREDGPMGSLMFDIAVPFTDTGMKCECFSAHVELAAEPGAKLSKEGNGEYVSVQAAPQRNEVYFETEEGLKSSDLQTGDDAIRYFSEADNGGPVQLVYCNRVSSGKEFTPYDLVVVPRSMVDLEHFIISAAGMVHIEPGPGYYMLLYINTYAEPYPFSDTSIDSKSSLIQSTIFPYKQNAETVTVATFCEIYATSNIILLLLLERGKPLEHPIPTKILCDRQFL